MTGTVTLDGQPLADAYVQFVGDDQITASGRTDAQGKFALQFDSQQSGITAGNKRVQIRTNYVTENMAMAEGASDSPAEKLPAKYHDQTTLKADVTSSQQDFTFDLVSK